MHSTNTTKSSVELLRNAGHRKVKAVARTETELSAALFDVAAGKRRYWDMIAWDALLSRLDKCEMSITDWLKEKGYE